MFNSARLTACTKLFKKHKIITAKSKDLTLSDVGFGNKVLINGHVYTYQGQARELLEPFFMRDDIYIFDDNSEDCGTLEELKEILADAEPPFDEKLCKLVTKKGTPFLWAE